MNWDDIRIFLAVARAGQILGASRALGLNHATVGRRLTALEDALGTRLFLRKTNGSELSTAGERFLVHAETIESAILVAEESSGTDSSIEGTVRVGAPDGFGVAFLAPRLSELTAQHPGLRIELVPVPRAFSLSRREADIAVTLERPREGRLFARKLTDYTLGLYASGQYLKSFGTPSSVAELIDHRLVGYVEDLIFAESLNYTDEYLRDWRSTIAVSSAMGQLEAVAAGSGIGILHRFMASPTPGLKAVIPNHTLIRSYWIVVHEDLRNIKRVAVVSKFISDLVFRERAIF